MLRQSTRNFILLTYFAFLHLAGGDLHPFRNLHDRKLALESFAAEARSSNLLRFANGSILEFLRQTTTILRNNFSQSCSNAMNQLVNAAMRRDQGALRMLDATGKPLQSGIMVGNLNSMGSYWECVNSSITEGTGQLETADTISGQYCRVSFELVNQTNLLAAIMKITWGVCIPNACINTDLHQYLERVWQVAREFPDVGSFLDYLKISEVVCQSNDPQLTTLAIAGICVAMAFVLLVVIGSAYDTMFWSWKGKFADGLRKCICRLAVSPFSTARREFGSNDRLLSNVDMVVDADAGPNSNEPNAELGQSTMDSSVASGSTSVREESESSIVQEIERGCFAKVLSAFSVRVNGAAILNTDRSEEQLDCLFGMRFISMVWIITGHTYETSVSFASDVLLAYNHYLNSWSFQLICNGTFSVDTFFVISGLLTTYVTLKYIGRAGGPGRFNWYLFYVHRYLRLTPVYGLMIFMFVSVYPYLSNGPFWVQQPNQACTQYWWTNLLYVNNFYNTSDEAICFGHAWYLANDMQFFIISPLVIIPLALRPLVGVMLTASLLAVSVISTAVISYNNDFNASILGDIFGGQNTNSLGPITQFNDVYVKPYCRIGSYAIGMLVGYILYRKKRKVALNPWIVVFGWATSTALACTVLFCLYDVTRGATSLSAAESAAYLSLSRITWSISIGWIILACSTGYGGWVNDFLSWKVFAPLSRLTYCAYLVHPPLLYILFSYVDTASDIREFPLFYYAAGNIVLAYAVAIGFSLAVETPLLRLEKLLFSIKCHIQVPVNQRSDNFNRA